MFSYIASLGIIVGFLVGSIFIFLAIDCLAKIQKVVGDKQISALRLKMAALIPLGLLIIIAGLLILKAKDISWAGEIVFSVIGIFLLWRLRYSRNEILRIVFAIAGTLLLAPPLYWLWCFKF